MMKPVQLEFELVGGRRGSYSTFGDESNVDSAGETTSPRENRARVAIAVVLAALLIVGAYAAFTTKSEQVGNKLAAVTATDACPSLAVGSKFVFETEESPPKIGKLLCLAPEVPSGGGYYVFAPSDGSGTPSEFSVRAGSGPCEYKFESVQHPGWFIWSWGQAIAVKQGMSVSFKAVNGLSGQGISFEYTPPGGSALSLGFTPHTISRPGCTASSHQLHLQSVSYVNSDPARKKLHTFKEPAFACHDFGPAYNVACSDGWRVVTHPVAVPGASCKFSGNFYGHWPYILTQTSQTGGDVFEHHAGYITGKFEFKANGAVYFPPRYPGDKSCTWTPK